jgi:hypothetical protein
MRAKLPTVDSSLESNLAQVRGPSENAASLSSERTTEAEAGGRAFAAGKFLASAPYAMLWALFLASAFLVFAETRLPSLGMAHHGWFTTALLVGGLLVTCAGLFRTLPLQNILMAVLVLLLIAGAVEVLAWSGGLGLGLPGSGATLLVWALAVLNARGVARFLLWPFRGIEYYGFALLGLSALLAAAGFLLWHAALGLSRGFSLAQIRTSNHLLLTGATASAVALFSGICITPVLLDKRYPGKRPSPEFPPVLIAAILMGIAFLS